MSNPSLIPDDHLNAAASARRAGWLRLTLDARITIAAPTHAVWRVLTDFDHYGDWNPAIPRVQGLAVPGAKLSVDIHWPGLKRGSYALQLLSVQPEQELRWLGHMGMRGLMDGDHRFRLTALEPGSTQLSQIEDFSGALVPLMAPWLRRNVLTGFVQMNAALKAYVEAQAAAGSGGR